MNDNIPSPPFLVKTTSDEEIANGYIDSFAMQLKYQSKSDRRIWLETSGEASEDVCKIISKAFEEKGWEVSSCYDIEINEGGAREVKLNLINPNIKI